ncbi:MAG: MBL fold metallo-hydrolase [Bacteroidetes bacterium]|nr:MBL fold metallo-hydrolase [Bacteroidota bacterium]
MNEKEQVKIQFLGAAGTVTGSKYLIEISDKKILVDCGLFQGLKELRLRNWAPLPFEVSSLDCVLITHGHLDHVGYLPLLVKQGFTGNIYATQPTIEITKLILCDSARIHEEDAERANSFRYSKHKPAKPLYTVKDAEAVFPFLFPKTNNQWTELFPKISFRFRYNGHIIGSVFIELKINEKLFVFSGDIGRENDPLMRMPEKPEQADILFIDSTYGNRLHPNNTKELLADAVNKACLNNGTILIPSFAVERTQLLMYYLWQLKNEKLIPSIPIYMDSPMGTNVLDVFQRNPVWHKLSNDDCSKMCRDIKIIQKYEETEHVANIKTSKIIIAGSGMASGGRVLTYFEHYLNDLKATILLVGFQGEGTRGRELLQGAKEIKMRGKLWPVKANVLLVEGLSAHADQRELINWLSELKNRPSKIFITHGEKESSKALSEKIKTVYGWNSEIPELNQITEVKN